MVIPMQYNKFGYKFLSPIGGGALHSGIDFNYWVNGANDDLGIPVKACADGDIVYSKLTGEGWGNMVVIRHNELNCWSRYAHLKNIVVKEGQHVKSGEIIGECGKTGTKSPHLHFDIIIKPLDKWTRYTHGWSKSKLLQYYVDPLVFINNANKERPYPDYAVEGCSQAKLMGLPSKDFMEMMTMDSIQADLKTLEKIQSIGPLPRYRWYTVLYKSGLLTK